MTDYSKRIIMNYQLTVIQGDGFYTVLEPYEGGPVRVDGGEKELESWLDDYAKNKGSMVDFPWE